MTTPLGSLLPRPSVPFDLSSLPGDPYFPGPQEAPKKYTDTSPLTADEKKQEYWESKLEPLQSIFNGRIVTHTREYPEAVHVIYAHLSMVSEKIAHKDFTPELRGLVHRLADAMRMFSDRVTHDATVAREGDQFVTGTGITAIRGLQVGSMLTPTGVVRGLLWRSLAQGLVAAESSAVEDTVAGLQSGDLEPGRIAGDAVVAGVTVTGIGVAGGLPLRSRALRTGLQGTLGGVGGGAVASQLSSDQEDSGTTVLAGALVGAAMGAGAARTAVRAGHPPGGGSRPGRFDEVSLADLESQKAMEIRLPQQADLPRLEGVPRHLDLDGPQRPKGIKRFPLVPRAKPQEIPQRVAKAFEEYSALVSGGRVTPEINAARVGKKAAPPRKIATEQELRIAKQNLYFALEDWVGQKPWSLDNLNVKAIQSMAGHLPVAGQLKLARTAIRGLSERLTDINMWTREGNVLSQGSKKASNRPMDKVDEEYARCSEVLNQFKNWEKQLLNQQ